MRLMFPEKIRVVIFMSIAVLLVLFAGDVQAQKRSASPKKAVQAKKTEKQARNSKKEARVDPKKTSAKNDKKDKRHDRKAEKDDKRGKERIADAKSKKDPKKAAESKRELAERRRKEEERRQAILAERRRREQAAREARERKLAFERGLKNETVANISRDQTDGEDLNIRRAAVEALAGHAGSVVVMEAQTGKVLTIVNQDWAVRTSIRPCSTIKLVTGTAGLNEGVINKADGSIVNANTRRHLDDAIAYSDNGYFQRVGSNLGNEKLVEYGRKLGLGQPTGINLEGETAGRLPYNNNNARIYSHGDDTEVSTLQLAVMVAAITNGGNRVLPRVPRNTIEQAKFQPFYRAKVDVPQTNIRRMIPGMMGTAEYGTAHRGVDASLGIAGKTGSCIDKGSWVGLFTSVAPIEKPKYAVAVITRGQSERGKYAAAVAGKIYRALSRGIVRTDRNLAQTEFNIAPKRVVPVRTAVDEDEDDNAADETSADAAAAPQPATPIIVPSAPRTVPVEKPAAKRLVQNTVNSKPVFKPVIITYDKDPSSNKRERVVPPR